LNLSAPYSPHLPVSHPPPSLSFSCSLVSSSKPPFLYLYVYVSDQIHVGVSNICLRCFPCWVLWIYWFTARFSLLGLLVYIGCLLGFACLLDCWVFFHLDFVVYIGWILFLCFTFLMLLGLFIKLVCCVVGLLGFVCLYDSLLGVWLTGFSFLVLNYAVSLCVMGERIPPGSYFQYPPPAVPASPIRSSSLPSDRERLVQHLELSVFSAIPFVFVIHRYM